MNKTYIRIILLEIKSSFGRFAAIFSIVALSVGFLSGLLVTTPDMKKTADKYYDENDTADIFIKSTMGLTNNDLATVRNLNGVEAVMPAYVTDILLDTDENEILTSRIIGVPLLESDGTVFINDLSLISGRMPQNKNECLVERSGGNLTGIDLGEKLIISEDNEDYDDIGDTYGTLEYTVVGIVSNPFYFSIETERSSIGNGRLGAIVYVDDSCYSMDVYTDFYIKAEGASGFTSFTEEYEKHVENIADEIDVAGKDRSAIRYKEVQDEAYEELSDAKIEYTDAKQEAETELADAAKELEDGRKELADAAVEIEDGKIELADAKVTLRNETDDAEKEISDGYVELSDAKIELDDGEVEYNKGHIKIRIGQKDYDDGLREFLDAEQELKDAQAEFDKGEQEYLDGVEELEEGKKKLKSGQRKLADAREQLTNAEAEYNAGVEVWQHRRNSSICLQTR
jgi:putative ABC transport system permease protein